MKLPLKNIKLATQALYFTCCLSVVVYESTKCIREYIAIPTATETTVESTKTQSFPIISLCPTKASLFGQNRTYYNETYLEDCGLR